MSEKKEAEGMKEAEEVASLPPKMVLTQDFVDALVEDIKRRKMALLTEEERNGEVFVRVATILRIDGECKGVTLVEQLINTVKREIKEDADKADKAEEK